MAATILAVSEDEAFSTMLQEGLESVGSYHVVMARSGDEARRAAASRRLDLMIVDADLEHTLPAQLVTEIRGFRPHLRLLWMLYLGQELPDHLVKFEAHGLLTKPFFIEDLGRQVEAALGHPPVVAVSTSDVAAAVPVAASLAATMGDAPAKEGARPPTATPEATNVGVRPAVPSSDPAPAVAAPLVGAIPSDGAGAAAPTKESTRSDPLRHTATPGAAGPGGIQGRTRPTTPTSETTTNADTKPAATPPEATTNASVRPVTNRREPGGSGIVLGSDRPSGPPRTPPASPTPSGRPGGTVAQTKTGPLGTGLHALARSLNAEAALLLDLEGRVVAWSGFASRRMAPELAAAITGEFAAAKRIAGVLRGRDDDFLTHIHEGKDFWLFSMLLRESNLILSVAVSADVPLGTVRYQVRQAATELSRNARK